MASKTLPRTSSSNGPEDFDEEDPETKMDFAQFKEWLEKNEEETNGNTGKPALSGEASGGSDGPLPTLPSSSTPVEMVPASVATTGSTCEKCNNKVEECSLITYNIVVYLFEAVPRCSNKVDLDNVI